MGAHVSPSETAGMAAQHFVSKWYMQIRSWLRLRLRPSTTLAARCQHCAAMRVALALG